MTRLAHLTVSGLRCLDGLELSLGPLTALIGANGAGKSSTVRAMEFLFGTEDLDNDDITNGMVDAEVSVTAVFTDLPATWLSRLQPWLTSDGDLRITRFRGVTQDGRPALRWSSTRRQVPSFIPVREALASGAPAALLKTAYAEALAAVGDLPAYTNKGVVLEALDTYEAGHPKLATHSAPDSTLRFGGGGEWDLGLMIELLVLPAMRDAADDAADSRNNTLGRLVELTVRSGLDLERELDELSARAARDYDQIIATKAGTLLEDLSISITEQLGSFAPGAKVTLTWQPRSIAMSPPTVRARIIESGHEADIGRQGHGVQRAYVFSLLRALLNARHGEAPDQPTLLLVIEEPEVYQHPVRARYVAQVLADLAADGDQSTQVLYTTHSPYFVSVDDVPAVRLLRLCPTGDATGPQASTRAFTASLPAIAERLNMARHGKGQAWTTERVAAQLPALLDSRLSEGLFADAVVLVEGEEDIGLIDGAASAKDVDLAGAGIALISVHGKSNLLLASEIVRALGVPVYTVFDTDEKPAGPTDADALRLNSMLLELAGNMADQLPPTTVTASWAAAKPTLRKVLDTEIGEEQVRLAYAQTAQDMGLPASTDKNGHMVRAAIKALYRNGEESPTLDALVASVVALSDVVGVSP